jgi:hypothetical protein
MISHQATLWQRSVFSLLWGIGLIGCSSTGNLHVALSTPDLTPINEIQQRADKSNVVYLKGNVGDRAPFLGSGAYQLQDQTGTIWIVTQKPLPSKGDEMSIKGEIQSQSIAIGQQQAQELYIVELEQLERRSQPQTETPVK